MTDIDKLTDLQVVAATLWGEARGEGVEGMIAVAHVIANRARKGGWWGSTPRDVCLKKWQFSCWNENDPNREKIIAYAQRQNGHPRRIKPLRAAHALVVAGFLALHELRELRLTDASPLADAIREMQRFNDPTFGATHYHTKAVSPSWAEGKEPCAVIGNHCFYNNID